jgi:hypothetical protein
MAKKKRRKPSLHIQQDGRWQTVPYMIDPDTERAMRETMDAIELCAACDAAQPEFIACIMVRRADLGRDVLGRDAFERHIFGVCAECQARYNAEEIDQIVRARFSRG